MITKMKPEVKDKLVAALRSGEFTQTTGYMKISQGDVVCHCATGVLTELAAREGVVQWTGSVPSGETVYFQAGEERNGFGPPAEVLIWAGLWDGGDWSTRPDGAVWLTDPDDINADVSTVIGMNDQGKSFAEIADAIEAAL